MDSAHCPKGSEAISCAPAFLGLHLTSEATAFLEVRLISKMVVKD